MIITHEGNLEFGHYRSCIKINDTNQRYEFIDNILKENSLEDSLFENAYRISRCHCRTKCSKFFFLRQ